MTTLMIIGLIAVGWLALAVVTWALCAIAAHGDAVVRWQLRAARDRTGRPLDPPAQRRIPAA